MATRIISDDVVEKAPGETIARYFDFANFPEVLDGETLASGAAVAEIGGTSDLTISNVAIDGATVTCKIAGGLAVTQINSNPDLWRTKYKLRCSVTTSGSNILILESYLNVDDIIAVTS